MYLGLLVAPLLVTRLAYPSSNKDGGSKGPCKKYGDSYIGSYRGYGVYIGEIEG